MYDLTANLVLICLAKATDENLTSENWEYILVRCEAIATRIREGVGTDLVF